MKYIKLIEDHSSKMFMKGDVMVIPKTSLSAWMETGIAEEATEKDFKTFNEEKEDARAKSISDSRKKHKEKVEVINKEDVTSQINELDLEGLKEYVLNRKIDLDITDDMTLEDARGFVLLAEEEKQGN